MIKTTLKENNYRKAETCERCLNHDVAWLGEAMHRKMVCTLTDMAVSPKGVCDKYEGED